MLEVRIAEISVTRMGFAIVLQPLVRNRVVPIFIGPLETYSISSALEGQKNARPLTHDLMRNLLDELECRLEKVIINNFKGGTFYSRIYLSRKGSNARHITGIAKAPDLQDITDIQPVKSQQAPSESQTQGDQREGDFIELDARPSDAIALAIRYKAPIYLTEEIYDKVAVELSILKEKKVDGGIFSVLDDSGQPKKTEGAMATEGNAEGNAEGNSEGISDEALQNALDDTPEEMIQAIMEELNEATSLPNAIVSPRPPRPEVKYSSEKELYQSKEDVLRKMLDVAVRKEKYEEAARIRDELMEMSKSLHPESDR